MKSLVRRAGVCIGLFLIIGGITYSEYGLIEALGVVLAFITLSLTFKVFTDVYLKVFHSYEYGVELIFWIIAWLLSSAGLYYVTASLKPFLLIGGIALIWSFATIHTVLKSKR